VCVRNFECVCVCVYVRVCVCVFVVHFGEAAPSLKIESFQLWDELCHA